MPLKYDIAGRRFGRLVVVGAATDDRMRGWKCLCDCGKTTVVTARPLVSGSTKSCGCLQSETCNARGTTHGKSYTRAYTSWAAMVQRCTSQDERVARWYAGVVLAPEFRSFDGFYAEMGDPPPGTSLDRIDGPKGYVPGNLRWVDWKTQQRNKRNARLITFNGETKCMAEWTEATGISRSTIRGRLRLGWDPERIFTEPPQIHKRK